ncbi:DUF167 domain-containing protein [Nordella sp. HKS 07]|uniref:DUF167 family protein n=1 Tax=Nordella sp. HKS 07 TaxID=2712222 RepID=UPI0013E1963F|nr:DUF167 family protein [Nordella sp. HKS 07]QIG48058.1 DUF167 domain-containing protein [Nordella sp. HKS 07]
MSPLPFRPEAQGGSLFLRVTPKSARAGLAGLFHGADGKVSLQVKVTAQPEKGKANEAVIDLLSEYLGLPRKAFTLTAGETSRLKTVHIAGDPTAIEQTLTHLIQGQTP